MRNPSKHLLNGFLQHVRRYHRLETQDGLAIFRDQELAEVPTDGVALVEAGAGLLMNLREHVAKLLGAFGIALERSLFLQISVEWTLILSVDVNFVEQGKGRDLGGLVVLVVAACDYQQSCYCEK